MSSGLGLLEARPLGGDGRLGGRFGIGAEVTRGAGARGPGGDFAAPAGADAAGGADAGAAAPAASGALGRGARAEGGADVAESREAVRSTDFGLGFALDTTRPNESRSNELKSTPRATNEPFDRVGGRGGATASPGRYALPNDGDVSAAAALASACSDSPASYAL
ncbi:MAG TPA: hypothetical protein VFS43_30345 [Polyangiaceae bacterium]|nr:hypothetical protein [Polyangiaceae bacterium]